MRTFVAAAVICFVAASQAKAADFPARRDLNARSLLEGVGRASLPLLRRIPGKGAAAVGEQLLARWKNSGPITTAGQYESHESATSIRFAGAGGWNLAVYNDGSALEYRNVSYGESHRVPVPVEKQLSMNELASRGRDFIATELSGVLELADHEELVEERALFARVGATDRDIPQAVTMSTVGAMVVFSRRIDGVAIVGGGSKVVIEFTTDGTPWAFSYDWPTYVTTATLQAILPLKDIRRRQSSIVPPPKNVASEEEERFECGYFDAGSRLRDADAFVQGGCLIRRVTRRVGDPVRYQSDPTNGLFTTVNVFAIPIGAVVEMDAKWQEAKAVLNMNTNVVPPRTRSVGPNRDP